MRFKPAHYLYWTVSECIVNIREEEETLILSDFSSLFLACVWATWIWNTNTQKNVAKFMSMMCFSEKETIDLIGILTEPHKAAVEDLDGFLSQGRFPTETHEVLLSSEPSLVRWHLLSFPARTVGHTSLTAPFWKTGSPHYVRAFISGAQVSFGLSFSRSISKLLCRGETGSPHFCEHTGKRIYNFSKLNMKRFKSSFLRTDN